MRTLSLVVAVAVASFAVHARAEEPVASDRPVKTELAPATAARSPELAKAPPPKPIYKRWELWTGVAVVVAAAVTAGVVASTVTQPGPHPLNAQNICGGAPCTGCIGLSCSSASAR